MFVSSKQRFPDFEFDGYIYHFISSKIDEGVISPEFSGGVKITDKERTLLDCIKDVDKYSGIEETINNIRGFQNLNELKLLHYLEQYNNRFLYQKTGFLLSCLNGSIGISNDFLEACHEHIKQTISYK